LHQSKNTPQEPKNPPAKPENPPGRQTEKATEAPERLKIHRKTDRKSQKGTDPTEKELKSHF
jgi:hypothetical protein